MWTPTADVIYTHIHERLNTHWPPSTSLVADTSPHHGTIVEFDEKMQDSFCGTASTKIMLVEMLVAVGLTSRSVVTLTLLIRSAWYLPSQSDCDCLIGCASSRQRFNGDHIGNYHVPPEASTPVRASAQIETNAKGRSVNQKIINTKGAALLRVMRSSSTVLAVVPAPSIECTFKDNICTMGLCDLARYCHYVCWTAEVRPEYSYLS